MHELILASASPRRQALLEQIGLTFTTYPVDIDESCIEGESPEDCVERLALLKARQALHDWPDAIVLGSDTMIAVDHHVLGKPTDKKDGLRMLEYLAGRSHEVLTGVAVIHNQQERYTLQRSIVTFRDLDKAEIEAYWQTGEPQDKAGAYAIQGIAAQFVSRLEGSYSGVMGLPLYETASLLAEFGIRPFRMSNA
ncbi:MAG: septum formation inhibitor Maf [Gammaproteobacteria bacterium]|nr:MAG: septum formation inhibitor Maf [Gammaproteobacteria bacterium]